MDKSDAIQQALEQAREAATRGDSPAAVKAASLAARLAREQVDEVRCAEAQSLLQVHLFTLGRFAESLREGQQALQGWQRLDMRDRVCETQLRIALLLSELGVHAHALALARAAFDQAQQHGLDAQSHQAVAMLGGLFGRAGKAEEGEVLLLQALSRARDVRDSTTAAMALNTLLALLLGVLEQAQAQGDAYRVQGLKERLRRHVGPAMSYGAEEPHPFRRVVLRGNAGAALSACGQHVEGLELLRSAAAEAADAGFRVAEMRQRVGLAQIHLALGDPAAALVELDRMHALLDAEPHQGARLDWLELQSKALAAQGQENAAAALAEQARSGRDAQAAEWVQLRERVERDAQAVLAQLAPGA